MKKICLFAFFGLVLTSSSVHAQEVTQAWLEQNVGLPHQQSSRFEKQRNIPQRQGQQWRVPTARTAPPVKNAQPVKNTQKVRQVQRVPQTKQMPTAVASSVQTQKSQQFLMPAGQQLMTDVFLPEMIMNGVQGYDAETGKSFFGMEGRPTSMAGALALLGIARFLESKKQQAQGGDVSQLLPTQNKTVSQNAPAVENTARSRAVPQAQTVPAVRYGSSFQGRGAGGTRRVSAPVSNRPYAKKNVAPNRGSVNNVRNVPNQPASIDGDTAKIASYLENRPDLLPDVPGGIR